jgi:hypothetical protein
MFGLVRVPPVELLHLSSDSILGFITPLLNGCLKGQLSHDHANNISISVHSFVHQVDRHLCYTHGILSLQLSVLAQQCTCSLSC